MARCFSTPTPPTARAINAVLVKKGVRVSELRKETTANQLMAQSHVAHA
jgi:hypothetical protein